MTMFDQFQDPAATGCLIWIGLRPARRAPVVSVDEARVDAAFGLDGDHFTGKSGRARQITLIQEEHLAVIAGFLGRPVPPELLRRNLVVRGVNLASFKGRPFRIGEVLARSTGACHPCSRMEAALGPGGLQAMRGHGGITAEILRGGTIRIGDPVAPAQADLFDAD